MNSKWKEKILFEGAQGILLDVDHGTYPYVPHQIQFLQWLLPDQDVGPDKIIIF